MKSPPDKPPPPQPLRGKLLTLATNFIAAMGLLAFAGYQLDQYLDTNRYIWTLVGLLLGFSWGFYEIIKFAIRSQKIATPNDITNDITPKK